MAAPNPAYTPEVEPIFNRTVYVEGWETTLSDDWTSMNAPPLTDWIGLDSILMTVSGAVAYITVEWTDSGSVYRRRFKLFNQLGVIVCRVMPAMATDSMLLNGLRPKGARVYMSAPAANMQLLENFSPVVMPYYVESGGFAALYPDWPPLSNLDGSEYVYPDLNAHPEITGLLLLTYKTARGFVVMGETRLTNYQGWVVGSQVNSGGTV